MQHQPGVDTSFDFRSDTPPGRDPDRWSVTLRTYHQRLWSKRLPSGVMFELDTTTMDGYLHHRSELGEFWLSSDTVVPTYRAWLRPPHLVDVVSRVDAVELDDFQRVGYTIGAMLVFPGNQIGRQWTINQARGMLRPIGDRLDLTLECIRRHYLGASSPMGDVLGRYADFFALFGDFRGYVDFFLLDDFTMNDRSSVEFLLPFDDFTTPALPQDAAQYETYRLRSIELVMARNRRIDVQSSMDELDWLREQGVVLQSARGPVPSLTERVAGAPIRGSWWGHPSGHEIYRVLNEVRASRDVVALRLINGKVTLVHRRLWPAMVRVADRFPPDGLAAIDEVHTGSGVHRTVAIPFPDWVPAEDLVAGDLLSVDEALEQLPACLR